MSGPSGRKLHSGCVKPVYIESFLSISKHTSFESIPPQKQTGCSDCCQREESDTEISNRDLLFYSTKPMRAAQAYLKYIEARKSLPYRVVALYGVQAASP